MTIRYIESTKSDGWEAAAKALINKLKDAGVKKGQLVYINAHGGSTVTAYYDDSIKSEEPLDIAYDFQWKYNNTPFEELYKRAADYASSIRPENLISMTGSFDNTNAIVFFVFHYVGEKANEQQRIRWSTGKQWAWKDSADEAIANLMNDGAKTGQIICTDTHFADWHAKSLHVAFWNASLPAKGDLQIEYELKFDKESWENHYRWASKEIFESGESKGENLNLHSVTSSWAKHEYRVTFVLRQADEIESIDYDLDNGKILESKPVVLSTVTNENKTDTGDQKMLFKYEQSSVHSTSNTSSFNHTAGASLQVGTTFSWGVPIILEHEISASLTTGYEHSWGQETTVSNDFSSSSAASVEVVAPPKTTVKCDFKMQKSEMEVPYVITMKSGRTNRGVWHGVNCYDFKASFYHEKISDSGH